MTARHLPRVSASRWINSPKHTDLIVLASGLQYSFCKGGLSRDQLSNLTISIFRHVLHGVGR